jgi:hypothetical protein
MDQDLSKIAPRSVLFSCNKLKVHLTCTLDLLLAFFFIKFLGRRDAYPTRKNGSCGMGILPVLLIFARGLF